MKNFTLKPRVADFAVIVVTAALVCVLKFMGITEIPENSLVENIQLIALFEVFWFVSLPVTTLNTKL